MFSYPFEIPRSQTMHRWYMVLTWLHRLQLVIMPRGAWVGAPEAHGSRETRSLK